MKTQARNFQQHGRTRVGRGAESEPSIADLVDKTLYIREHFNVSNQTYELAVVNKGLPRTSASSVTFTRTFAF